MANFRVQHEIKTQEFMIDPYTKHCRIFCAHYSTRGFSPLRTIIENSYASLQARFASSSVSVWTLQLEGGLIVGGWDSEKIVGEEAGAAATFTKKICFLYGLDLYRELQRIKVV